MLKIKAKDFSVEITDEKSTPFEYIITIVALYEKLMENGNVSFREITRVVRKIQRNHKKQESESEE